MLLKLTTGIPSFLIWLRPSDNLLATVSSCHQQWLMNCDILLSLSLRVSLSLHFTLYRLLKYSPIPAILNTPSLLLSLALLSLCPFHSPVCRAHSPPRALLYLVPFIWLIWYLELIGLWIEACVFTYICLHLPISHFSLVPSLLFSSAFLSFSEYW